VKEIDKAPRVSCYREHAKIFGYAQAVVLSHFMFWINKNKENRTHFYEGHYWSYGSIRKLQKYYFPYFTQSQVRSAIKSLLDSGQLLKGKFNKYGYDKTLWYALKDVDHLLKIAIPFEEYDRWDEVNG
jgi:hypothetical protein